MRLLYSYFIVIVMPLLLLYTLPMILLRFYCFGYIILLLLFLNHLNNTTDYKYDDITEYDVKDVL